jgi:hypothetical protein
MYRGGTISQSEQQCLVTTDFTHLGNVWTGAAPSTLKKLNKICGSFALNDPERKGRLELLAERIAQLPEALKNVSAMYYYEGASLGDLAACFNLSKAQICQIHAEAVNELRQYVCSAWVEREQNEAR